MDNTKRAVASTWRRRPSAPPLAYASEAGVDCNSIIAGDEAEMDRAAELAYNQNWMDGPDFLSAFGEMPCPLLLDHLQFRSSYVAGAPPTANPSRPFPLAFIILTHDHFEQTLRLLRALYETGDAICIHVDQDADESLFYALDKMASCLNHVIVTPRRFSITWGSISLVDALLSCMDELLNSPVKWRYVFNYAGSAFPVRTNSEMALIMEFLGDFNLVEGVPGSRFKSRTEMKKAKPPHNITLTKGSQYGAFSRGFVEFAARSPVASDLRHWLDGTVIPDEHFWSTLNHNPHLQIPGGYPLDQCETAQCRAKQPFKDFYPVAYSKWVKYYDSGAADVGVPCAARFVEREVCIFGMADLRSIVTLPHFQVNKFHFRSSTDFQPFAYSCLEEWRKNRTANGEEEVPWSYYETMRERLRSSNVDQETSIREPTNVDQETSIRERLGGSL